MSYLKDLEKMRMASLKSLDNVKASFEESHSRLVRDLESLQSATELASSGNLDEANAELDRLLASFK